MNRLLTWCAQAAWAAEGLKLKSPPTGLNEDGGGMMGSSFDAQRLIMFAREEGREDQMIEAIYSANHEQDLCLRCDCFYLTAAVLPFG